MSSHAPLASANSPRGLGHPPRAPRCALNVSPGARGQGPAALNVSPGGRGQASSAAWGPGARGQASSAACCSTSALRCEISPISAARSFVKSGVVIALKTRCVGGAKPLDS